MEKGLPKSASKEPLSGLNLNFLLHVPSHALRAGKMKQILQSVQFNRLPEQQNGVDLAWCRLPAVPH